MLLVFVPLMAVSKLGLVPGGVLLDLIDDLWLHGKVVLLVKK